MSVRTHKLDECYIVVILNMTNMCGIFNTHDASAVVALPS